MKKQKKTFLTKALPIIAVITGVFILAVMVAGWLS